MKASICFVALGASVAAAGAINKRVLEIVTEVDIVWETVWETTTVPPSSSSSSTSTPAVNKQATSTTSSTVEPPPVAVPTIVVPSVQPTVAPAPVTTEAPTTTAAPPAPVTTAPPATSPDPVSVAPASPLPLTTSPTVDTLAQPTDFISGALYSHNVHRVNNSAPAVTWGQTYADYAQTVSSSCKFAHDLTPGGGGYGQNIAMFASTGDIEAVGAQSAISQAISNMWYNGEINLYPSDGYGLDNPDFSNFESWGHYSQVVWVGSTVIGCDAHFCPAGTMEATMGAWFSVCNYFPAGNMGGEYGKNVLPPLGMGTVSA